MIETASNEIKSKPVELIELFYDLIYVYAISRLTGLIRLPENGVVPLSDLVRYLVLFFVILQAWLYLTNYVNRYGRWRWYEYGITTVNMVAAIYLSNTISTAWEENYVPFNIAMLVMLLTVVLLYSIQIKKSEHPDAAKNSIKILLIVCLVYAAGIACILLNQSHLVIWLDVIAVLLGAFLPFFLRGNFDHSIISFPHLTERFELLTIITFGEGVVGMTDYFDVEHFTILPILIFAVIITMFGGYVVQIHYLLEHKRVDRALRLMFSHYFIVIALNMMTIGIHMLHQLDTIPGFVPFMMITAEIAFYIAILANHPYYKTGFTLNRKDLIAFEFLLLIGILTVMLKRHSVYGILAGILVVTAGNFAVLLRKYMNKNIII